MEVLRELEKRARAALAERYPDNAVDFSSDTWNVDGPHRPRIKKITWPTTGEGRPHLVVRAAKAYWVLSNTSASNAITLVGGLTGLSRTLHVLGCDSRWEALDQSVFDRVETYLVGKESTVYIRMRALWSFLEWLKDEGLASPDLELPIRARRDDRGGLHRKANMPGKLPALEVVTALGELYREVHAPPDRLRLALVAIMLVTGLRVDEMRSLRVDGLEGYDDGSGRTRWRVLYANRKSPQGSEMSYGVRWLSSLGAELVREAWAIIEEITQPWREFARRAHVAAELGRYPIEEIFDREWVLWDDLAVLLGLNSRRSKSYYLSHQWPDAPLHDARGLECWGFPLESRNRPKAVHRAAARQHIEGLITYTEVLGPDDQRTPLHELLAIHPPWFLHGRAGRVLTPEPITSSWAESFLSDPDASVFAHYKRVREDGSPMRMNPHSVRHFVNTMANKAGMTAMQISLWMGRTDHFQTYAYLHDPEDWADYQRFSLMEQRRSGVIQDRLRLLPAKEREVAVQDIRVAHAAGHVTCSLNFMQRECPRGGACATCPDALHSNDPIEADRRAVMIGELQVNLEVLRSLPRSAPVARTIANTESEMAALLGVSEVMGGSRGGA